MSEVYRPYNDAERMDMRRGIEQLEEMMTVEAVAGKWSSGLVLRTMRYEATLRQLEQGLVAVTAERDKALRERDHWITRLHVEQEKHTDTDAARTKWLFKAAELERERDALKEELEEVSADRDSWRSVTRYD